MYVIKRTDHGGGYVAKPGSRSSYTRDFAKARRYPTKEEAERDLCKENEIILEAYHVANR